MRSAEKNDAVFDCLPTERDKIVFNLFDLIRESPSPMIWTDDQACILAQSSETTPLWAFFASRPDRRTEEEAAQILAERLSASPGISVCMQATRAAGVLARVDTLTGRKSSVRMPMNAYVCRKAAALSGPGRLIAPRAADKARIAELMIQMAADAAGQTVDRERAEAFAETAIGANTLFLWEDGEIVSMAHVSHRSARYARFNTVVTDRCFRGRGYAKLLMAAASARILAEGLLPMLYADTRNPASNAAYQSVGYEYQGTVTEYGWE